MSQRFAIVLTEVGPRSWTGLSLPLHHRTRSRQILLKLHGICERVRVRDRALLHCGKPGFHAIAGRTSSAGDCVGRNGHGAVLRILQPRREQVYPGARVVFLLLRSVRPYVGHPDVCEVCQWNMDSAPDPRSVKSHERRWFDLRAYRRLSLYVLLLLRLCLSRPRLCWLCTLLRRGRRVEETTQ